MFIRFLFLGQMGTSIFRSVSNKEDLHSNQKIVC